MTDGAQGLRAALARVARLDAAGELRGAAECENPGCGASFDPIATRWRCPACGFKANCCEGAQL